jgi:hypothetical protein
MGLFCTFFYNDIPLIYYVYPKDMHSISKDMHSISKIYHNKKRSYRPPALPTHGLEDNVPDVHDEADFDISYTQAVLERFMTHISLLADVEYRVQGSGELRCKDLVSYCCHMISIYLLYALHIPCIFHIYIK